MQRLEEVKAAKSSWLAQRISDKAKIPAYLNLLPVKDEVLALAREMSKDDLKRSVKEFQKDLHTVHGVDYETMCGDFAVTERYCNDPRNSVVSSSGSIVSNWSIFSRSSARDSLFSVLSQYSNNAGIEQRFYCPSCTISYTRSHGMDKHMREKCEDINLVRHSCHDCSHKEKFEEDMLDHIKKHGKSALGYGRFTLPAKRSFGCPHCEMNLPTLTAFQDHLTRRHFLEEKIDNRGSPSRRVRAGIRAADLVEAVEEECRRRNLPDQHWLALEWDPANAWWFWEYLEHGIMDENEEHSYMGVRDVPSFVKALVDKGLGKPDYDNAALVALVGEASTTGVATSQTPFSVNETLPLTTAEPPALPLATPCPHDSQLHRQRKSGKLPLRNLPAQAPWPQTLPTEPAFGFGMLPSCGPSDGAGHKHNLSAGSILHPDDIQRSHNSPAPPAEYLSGHDAFAFPQAHQPAAYAASYYDTGLLEDYNPSLTIHGPFDPAPSHKFC